MINILFDVDDTLYDQLIPFKDAYHEVFDQYQYNCSIELLFVKSRYYSDEVFELVNAGKMTKTDMHIYRISKAFESLGIQIKREDAFLFQSIYESNQKKIVLHPEMKEVLHFAKCLGINMGVITNGPTSHQESKIAQLLLTNWIKEENIFISGKVGISKPSQKIFSYVQEKMGIIPENSYYIGDSYMNDVVGAKKAGWKSIWVNRRNHPISNEMEYNPDYIMDAFNSPTSILKKILIKNSIKL
ncbi:HAD family hydrolase [Niallia nealsonii]|uniref:Hydrolase n=1 Tax=Niallia nealsonii TaxID=115979 RepID=A0A2N0Z0D9_9BACI|nr:HAD family hydrolase [Niallia nealsonii]PKG22974.1 hydrolase [Niallia nealsonii]